MKVMGMKQVARLSQFTDKTVIEKRAKVTAPGVSTKAVTPQQGDFNTFQQVLEPNEPNTQGWNMEQPVNINIMKQEMDTIRFP